MGIASLTGRLGNMIAPFTATVVGIFGIYYYYYFLSLG